MGWCIMWVSKQVIFFFVIVYLFLPQNGLIGWLANHHQWPIDTSHTQCLIPMLWLRHKTVLSRLHLSIYGVLVVGVNQLCSGLVWAKDARADFLAQVHLWPKLLYSYVRAPKNWDLQNHTQYIWASIFILCIVIVKNFKNKCRGKICFLFASPTRILFVVAFLKKN